MIELEKFVARTSSILAPEFEERDRRWEQSNKAIERQHAARGMLRSGNTIHALDRSAADELRVRAARIFSVATQVAAVQGMQLEPVTAEAMKADLRARLDQTYAPMRRAVIERVQALGLDARASARSTDELDFARHNVELKMFSSLDLLVDEAQARRDSPAAASPSIHVSGGYVGAIQTGAVNTANIAISLTATDREAIERALTAFAELLQNDERRQTPMLRELVDDGRRELERETPNTARLSTILQTLANACQGIAGAPAVVQLAYDALALVGAM